MVDTLFGVTVDRTDSDERFTPAWLFRALGETFDLDPASPIEHETHVPARTVYTREDDGLVQPWHGFVWLNPPFSNATPWADRFMAHGNGLWLGPVANSAWTQRMATDADAMWLMRDFAFDHPTHAGRRSSMPLAMYAMGERAREAMMRASMLCPDAGVVLSRVLFEKR